MLKYSFNSPVFSYLMYFDVSCSEHMWHLVKNHRQMYAL